MASLTDIQSNSSFIKFFYTIYKIIQNKTNILCIYILSYIDPFNYKIIYQKLLSENLLQ